MYLRQKLHSSVLGEQWSPQEKNNFILHLFEQIARKEVDL